MPTATPYLLILYAKNTQDIQLFGIKDQISGTFWDAATITATLYDDQEQPVPECTDISLAYQTGSTGNYVGTFGDISFNPAVGTGYTLVIDGDQGGAHLHVSIPVNICARQS